MQNLPTISIETFELSGSEFLQRIESLIISDENLKNLFSCDFRWEIYPALVLDVMPKYSTEDENSIGQFIMQPKLPKINGIRLEELFDVMSSRFPDQTKYDDKLKIFRFYPESEEWCLIFKEATKIANIKINLEPLHPEKKPYPFYKMKEINKLLKEIIKQLKEIERKESDIKWIPGNDKKVNILLRAEKCSNAYVEEVERLFSPIIKAYNQKYGSKIKLDIRPLKSKNQFPFTLEKLFNKFIDRANKSSLHPYDWKRYYEFIRGCHYRRFKDTELLENRLIQGGFSEEYAEKLVAIFEHSYEVLSTCVPIILKSLSHYYWKIIQNIIKPIQEEKQEIYDIEVVKAKVKNNKVELILKCFFDDPFLKEKILEIKRKCPEIISIEFV